MYGTVPCRKRDAREDGACEEDRMGLTRMAMLWRDCKDKLQNMSVIAAKREKLWTQVFLLFSRPPRESADRYSHPQVRHAGVMQSNLWSTVTNRRRPPTTRRLPAARQTPSMGEAEPNPRPYWKLAPRSPLRPRVGPEPNRLDFERMPPLLGEFLRT